MIGIRSHYNAGTAALAIETREETRLLKEIVSELPKNTPVTVIAAPTGALKCARTGRPIDATTGQPATSKEAQTITGLNNAYQWAQNGPGRVLIVYDWHVLTNNPGAWRALIETIPGLRSPKNSKQNDPASLAVFVGPHFQLIAENPLRGALPILPYAPPDRAAIGTVCEALAPVPADSKERVIDALSGLAADSAEQAAAEVLARGRGWDVDALYSAKREELKRANVEILPSIAEIGGLTPLRQFVDAEMIPWRNDTKLRIRRLLLAGTPGNGKSFFAQYLAHRYGIPCARVDLSRAKSSLVGASEATLDRLFRTLDTLAPAIVLFDELDLMTSGARNSGDPTAAPFLQKLLSWLQESKSANVIVATLNHLEKLDAAVDSRFSEQWHIDLPTSAERRAVAAIHLSAMDCTPPVDSIARAVADCTDGFSSREIAEKVVPTLLRQTQRRPDTAAVSRICAGITPTSRANQEALKAMRDAVRSLRRANDPDEGIDQTPLSARRQIAGND